MNAGQRGGLSRLVWLLSPMHVSTWDLVL